MGKAGLGFLVAGSEARSKPYKKMRCDDEELVSPKDKSRKRPSGQIKGIIANKEKDEKDEQEE